MKPWIIGRRDFIRMGLLGGALGVSGCGINSSRPVLITSKGVLPTELLQAMPSPWRVNFIDSSTGVDPYRVKQNNKNIDLLVLGDGWLHDLHLDDFRSIEAEKLTSRLSRQGILFISDFGPDIAMKLLPIGCSPWVMLFRRGEAFLPRAKESWKILLDPALEGKIILPKSSRLVMSLADRMGTGDQLSHLRAQVRTYDDQNGLSWLLAGKAQVVVLPLQSCMSSLSRDPRLTVAIPRDGSPLNWTLMLRPKFSNEPFPQSWVEKAWDLPLLTKLLSRGWIPPISNEEIMKGLKYLPENLQEILLDVMASFDNSWSLSPLSQLQEYNLEKRWLD